MNNGLLGWPLGIQPQPGMFGFPLGRRLSTSLIEAEGEGTGATYGTTITCGAAHTKGAWSILSEGLPHGCDGFYILLSTYAFNNRQFLIDVAIGKNGNEVVLVSNIQSSFGTVGGPEFLFVPLPLPAGTPISIRAQSGTAASPITFGLLAISSQALSSMGFTQSVTFGADPTLSRGVTVDSGAVANTFGAWTEIVAQTEKNVRYMVVCIDNQQNTVMSNASGAIQLALGPDGSEQTIVEDFFMNSAAASDLWIPVWLPLWLDIPAGSRISARGRCTTTDANDRKFGLTLVGFS